MTTRPQLTDLLSHLRDGDAIVALHLARLGRSRRPNAVTVPALEDEYRRKLAQAQQMWEIGMHLAEIAEIIGVGCTALYRHLK